MWVAFTFDYWIEYIGDSIKLAIERGEMMRNLYDRLHDKVLIKYVKNPMTECYSKDYVFKYQEENYDATVIIPCYNVEKYVAECMESILK